MLELTQIRTRINLLHKIYALVSGITIPAPLLPQQLQPQFNLPTLSDILALLLF